MSEKIYGNIGMKYSIIIKCHENFCPIKECLSIWPIG